MFKPVVEHLIQLALFLYAECVMSQVSNSNVLNNDSDVHCTVVLLLIYIVLLMYTVLFNSDVHFVYMRHHISYNLFF